MSKRKRFRSICLMGTSLLLGVMLGVVAGRYFGSDASIPRQHANLKDSIESIPSNALPPAAPGSSRITENNFSQHHPPGSADGGEPGGGRSVHFISRDEYEKLISALFLLFLHGSSDDPASGAGGVEALVSALEEADLPEKLAEERFEIRQYYRELLEEKRRWDRYRRERYESILESRIEPARIRLHDLNLKNEENLEYFEELEVALNLHNRLVRDVRIFHDEVQYQGERARERRPYQPYELKYNLNPFARESALADALQQAMSSMSVGIYHQEASEVIQRVCDEFVKPVQMLDARSPGGDESSASFNYNYNMYIVFAKKLMNYSNALLEQSSIQLASSSRGELDFINRRLSESLNNLYEIGQQEAIPTDYLDLEELEREIHQL